MTDPLLLPPGDTTQPVATAEALAAAARRVLDVSQSAPPSAANDAFVFYGRLLTSADEALHTLEPAFAALGFTPLIQRARGQYAVVAFPGLLRGGRTRLWLHLLLAAITVLTTTWAGAQLAGVDVMRRPLELLIGLPFSLTLMVILTTHELGHYFMGRWHGVHVSLPYFIPAPFSLGTFGAFIQMRSPIRNRRELFDVGLAGPVAGFLAAMALLIVGLLLSDWLDAFRTFGPRLGDSLLTALLTNLLRPQDASTILSRNPIALASYFGILLTGINLLPAGQLDGGHIAYALFGRRARLLGVLVVAALLMMGWLFWTGWYLWAALIFFTGLRHATPLNDVTGLDAGRWAIAVGAVVIFLLTFIPQPLLSF